MGLSSHINMFPPHIRIVMLGPLFFFPFFSVDQSGLDVVVALHRARVSFRRCSAGSEPQVRRGGAARRLAAEQLDGQPLRTETGVTYITV